MNNYSPQSQNLSDEDTLAQLTITVSTDQEFGYTCNWECSDGGIGAVASIFYGVAYDDLVEKILEELKSRCVLEDNEGDFLSIMQSIRDLVLSADNGLGGDSGESLVVSPRDVLKLF